MFNKDVFATRLRELRLSRKVNQDDLAGVLGVTKTQISDMERSRRTTTIEKCVELANYFGVSLDYLVGRDSSNEVRLNDLAHDLSDELDARRQIEEEKYEYINPKIRRSGEVGKLVFDNDFQMFVLGLMSNLLKKNRRKMVNYRRGMNLFLYWIRL